MKVTAGVSEETISKLGSMKATNLSIQDLLQTGLGARLDPVIIGDIGNPEELETTKSTRRGSCEPSDVRLQIATFLHAELPKRYAHRIKELDALPVLLRTQPPIQRVRRDFAADIANVLRFTRVPNTSKEDLLFANCIQENMQRHASTLVLTAHGLFQYQQEQKQNDQKATNIFDAVNQFYEEEADDRLQDQLNAFQMGRIGTRILCAQYLELHRQHHVEQHQSQVQMEQAERATQRQQRLKDKKKRKRQQQRAPREGQTQESDSESQQPQAGAPLDDPPPKSSAARTRKASERHKRYERPFLPPTGSTGAVGVVYSATNPSHEVRLAALDAQELCEQVFGEAPDVILEGD